MKYFKGLSKEKLQYFILTVIVSIIVVGGVLNFYVLGQRAMLIEKSDEVTSLTTQIDNAQTGMKQEVNNTGMRDRLRAFVESQQAHLVDGDPFIWFNREFSLFIEKFPVRIQGLRPGSRSQHPIKSKYEWYTTRFEAHGNFDDIGKFLRDLENTFPTGSIRSLDLAGGGDNHKGLTASIEFSFLIKPTTQPKKAS